MSRTDCVLLIGGTGVLTALVEFLALNHAGAFVLALFYGFAVGKLSRRFR